VAALIKRIDQLLTDCSSVAVMPMSITTPSWRRTLKLKVWAGGKDYALVRVLEGSAAFVAATTSLGLRSEYGSSPWGLFVQAGVYF
jgi:hypothetical protein